VGIVADECRVSWLLAVHPVVFLRVPVSGHTAQSQRDRARKRGGTRERERERVFAEFKTTCSETT
jgi:hypothetical protein